MNEGLKCLLLSGAVGLFLGFCGALLNVSAPDGRVLGMTDRVRGSLLLPWLRPYLKNAGKRNSRRRTGVLRFLRDALYPVGCAVVFLIFLSAAGDGEARLYMLLPFAAAMILALRVFPGAACLFRCIAGTLTADVCLTVMWPLLRAVLLIGRLLRVLWKKSVLSLRRKYDMMKKKQTEKREARGFVRFRELIIKELKTWPRSSDVSISPKLQKP